MSNYVIYYKTIDSNVEFLFVNDDTNDVLLDRKYAFDDEDDIVVYMRQMLTEIQSSLPKGHTINVQVVDLNDIVQA